MSTKSKNATIRLQEISIEITASKLYSKLEKLSKIDSEKTSHILSEIAYELNEIELKLNK